MASLNEERSLIISKKLETKDSGRFIIERKDLRCYKLAVFMFFVGFRSFMFSQVNQEYLNYRFSTSPDLPETVQEILAHDEMSMYGCNDESANTTNLTSIKNDIETEVSSQASLFSTQLALFRQLPPIFTSIVLCAYSEHSGRKFCWSLYIIGCILSDTIYMLVEIFSASLQWLNLANFLFGVSGSQYMVFGCTFAYIIEIQTQHRASFKMLITECAYVLSATINGLIVGDLVENLGFIATFGFLVTLSATMGLYLFFVIEEDKRHNASTFSVSDCFRKTWNAAMVVFYKRYPRSDQAQMIILFFYILLVASMTFGFPDLIVAYLESPPFCLGPVDIGYFNSIKSIATVLAPPLMWWILHKYINPCSFAIILTCITIAGTTFFAFCKTLTELYIGEFSLVNT